MRKALIGFIGLLAGAGAGLAAWLYLTAPPPLDEPAVDITHLLVADDAGFAQVDPARPYAFPEDHAAHPDFRTESWYFTGTLADPHGRRFGFQLTFFRLALAPQPPAIDSAWATNQVYRAHLAVADPAGERFFAFERFSRAALGLSGSERSPVRVWLEHWTMEVLDNAESPVFRLQASAEELRLALQLRGIKPVVRPDQGGDAFHAYLLTRLQAEGALTIGAETFAVEGLAWLDRAWGMVPLPQGQIALNRFLIQLDDGREILLVQVRRRDGSRPPVTTGLLVQKDGAAYALGRREIEIDVLDHWTGPDDGTRYPSRWRLRLPAQNIDLEIAPYLGDQELRLSIRYWAGAVAVGGLAGDEKLTGNGYVELTGYADGS